MKISRRYLRGLIKEQVHLLLEEEEDPFATDDEAEAEDADADAGGEEAEDAPEEEAEEEEEHVDVTPEEEASLSKSADDQIMAHIVDFETNAMKSATVQADDMLRPDPANPEMELEVESRWYKKDVSSLLYEESEDSTTITPSWVGSTAIDVATFSNDVSRLVQNYDSLLDMEALIIAKAKDYILANHDQETADYFEEVMDQHHDMRVADPTEGEEIAIDPPPAIGSGYATQPGGGGA